METRTGQRRPLRVAEIHPAIIKGGIQYKKDRLFTTLGRSPLFHSPKSGLWGLASWYPDSALKKEARSEPTEETPDPESLRVVGNGPDDAAVA